MIKQSKKKVSLLIVFCMVLTMLFGYAAPAAASAELKGVVIGNVPTFPGAVGTANLANIRFGESGATIGTITTGTQITVSLPTNVTFQTVAGAVYSTTTSGLFEGSNVAVTHPAVTAGQDEVTLTLTRTGSLNTAAAFVLKFPVAVGAGSSGDIVVALTTTSTGVVGGDFVVGRWGTGSVTVSTPAATIPSISIQDFSTAQSTRAIRFSENMAGAFRTGSLSAHYVTITLPAGLTWAGSTTVPETVGDFRHQVNGANTRELRVWRESTSVTAQTFSISRNVFATRLAPSGEISVTVIGEGNNSSINASAVIAKTADYGVTVERRANVNPTTVTAGRAGQSLAAVEVKELIGGSLIPGGTITITLPEEFQFNFADAAAVTAANTFSGASAGMTVSVRSISANKRTITYNVSRTTQARETLVFTFAGNVLVGPKAKGEVALTVGGTAGAAGTVVVANVRDVFSVSAGSVASLRTGADAQAAGDIRITEAAAGRIEAGQIVLTLPAGFKFTSLPTVAREGNLNLGTARLEANRTRLIIPVDHRSTTASTITVSGIRYDVDRSVNDGNVKVSVAGSALVAATVETAQADFPDFDMVEVVNARIGAGGHTVFTIGATTYTVDGVAREMDVAPFIKNGRTMLPLRFTAEAAGVNTEEIIWDSVRRTVTLIRGDRVVQVQIGSTTMLINGIAVTMDVAPEIVNGRTVLPMRWVGMALRANVEWNETNKTVHVMPL